MVKVFKNVEEVREAREAGRAFVFNLEMATKVAKSVAPKTSSTGGKLGALNQQLVDLFKSSGEALTIGQVCAGFEACGAEITKDFRKAISDKCWGLAKKGILVKLGGGAYQIAQSDAPEAETVEEVVESDASAE